MPQVGNLAVASEMELIVGRTAVIESTAAVTARSALMGNVCASNSCLWDVYQHVHFVANPPLMDIV
jgi:hypothetical protein